MGDAKLDSGEAAERGREKMVETKGIKPLSAAS
jgi:hypothetical protein